MSLCPPCFRVHMILCYHKKSIRAGFFDFDRLVRIICTLHGELEMRVPQTEFAEKPPRRTQVEKSAETRRLMIMAAIAGIRESGIHRLTLRDVANRTGLSRGALQHHFDKRDMLIFAVLDYAVDQIFAAFEFVVAMRSAPLEARISHLIDALWAAYRSDEYLAIYEIWVGCRAEPQLAPQINAYYKRIILAQERHWSKTFASDCRVQENLSLSRRLVLGALRGFAIQTVMDRQTLALQNSVEACKVVLLHFLRSRTPLGPVDPAPRKITD